MLDTPLIPIERGRRKPGKPLNQLTVEKALRAADKIAMMREEAARPTQTISFAPFFRQHLPRVLDPRSDIPYVVLYGGRGGMKSWTAAQALIIKAYTRKRLVLCAREFQTSIKDSVHSVLKNQISDMGLGPWFDIQKTEIRSTTTGSLFIFKGLHHNVSEIKSIEGIDDCWVEEAEAVSEDSWETLLPTLFRRQGGQLWITFNPKTPDAPTYKKWVVAPPPEALVLKTSYRDNPRFPEGLERQRAHMERTDPDAYMNIWEGYPRSISEATIFRNRFSVRAFDQPEKVERFFFGADFGFANDPSTLIRSYIVGNTLYIDREAYGVGVELDDMPAFYRGGRSAKTGEMYEGIPDVDGWPIYADSARPETISYLRRQGFNIKAADKWQGCVEDGIAHLKGFDEIVIHPRCPRMADEARLYSYKVDKQTNDVLPVVEDLHNHCWDAVRYGLTGHIGRSGAIGTWRRLAGR